MLITAANINETNHKPIPTRQHRVDELPRTTNNYPQYPLRNQCSSDTQYYNLNTIKIIQNIRDKSKRICLFD